MAISYQALNIFGPLLIGAFLNTLLYGVCVVQSLTYYQTYKKDAKWLRHFVLYLFIMETCNTIFDIGLVFEPLVLNYGNPESFVVAPRLLILDAIVTVLISTPVQFFLARRIMLISESRIMPLIIVFLASCAFVGGCTQSISASFFREWSSFKRLEGPLITWLTASAVADLLITVSLCLVLHRRKTGMKSTDDRVSKIIRVTMQTGLVTTIFALLDVIVALTVHRIALNFTWDFALSKLYTNSLLSTLNARDRSDLAVQSDGRDIHVFSERNITGREAQLSKLTFRHNIPGSVLIEEDRMDLESMESGIVGHRMTSDPERV